MRRLFDLIIDILLFFGDFICNMPSYCINGVENMILGFHFVFTILPFRISLIYRFRKLWYPVKSDFNPARLTDEKKEWLNTNLGRYRWKVISRLEKENSYYAHTKRYLCFRYKTDAVAFKLRWTE